MYLFEGKAYFQAPTLVFSNISSTEMGSLLPAHQGSCQYFGERSLTFSQPGLSPLKQKYSPFVSLCAFCFYPLQNRLAKVSAFSASLEGKTRHPRGGWRPRCPFWPPWWAGLLVTVTFLLRDSQGKAITSHSWHQPSAWTDVGSCLTGFCPWGQTGSGLSPKWAGSLPEGLRAALPVPGPEGEQLTSVQLSSGCPAGRAHGGQQSLEDREEGAVHELEASPPGLPGAGCSGQSALEQ